MFRQVFRNFQKFPVFSSINLAGLSIGIAASFILLVYTQREMSTDRQFRDADRIARIGTNFFQMGPFAVSQPMMRDYALRTCKDVEDATAISGGSETMVRTNRQDRAFTGIYPYYIDSSFFHVFSFEVQAGALPSKGLSPTEVILSASEAEKFFGKENPIGKTLYVDKDMTPCTVVAVLKESFAKSHLQPRVLLYRAPDKEAGSANWSSASLYNYVKLRPQGSIAGLNAWLDRLRETVVYPSAHTTDSYTKWKSLGNTVTFVVQPLTDIYFHSDLKFDLSPGGNILQVRLLSAISLLLILLAIINYINLVTARSSIRAKEIGLKKTFGAARGRLVSQLLKESLIFSGLAMLLACGLIQAILFLYQSSTGAALTGPIPFLSANYIWLTLFSLAVGLLAGIYPAIYLTGFRPGLIVRSTSGTGKNNPLLRNSLVTIQFAIATGLLFVSLVVFSQLQYMSKKDKGLRTEGVVMVENAGDMKDRAVAFRQLVNQQSQVASTSFCVRAPASNVVAMGAFRTATMQKNAFLQTFPVDDNYISTFGIHLMDGRNFNKDLLSDTNSLILNESAVAELGLFKPVGTLINGSERVIGVVKDFNYASLHEKIGPAVLRFSPEGNTLAIRLRGGRTAAFLDWLKNTSKEYLPDESASVSFLDDNFARLAQKEQLLGKAITFFTVLAILLATLGLIGLTIFTIERRTKEIGIRKVLGAAPSDILGLVAGNFLRLSIIAAIIAGPISWWLINRWLDNFAYRISISGWTFVLTEAIILAIAFSVIGLLTLRALAADPVKNLRSE